MDCISCHPEGENHMQELKLKRVYRHFKGDYYLVEDVAKDSETGEEYVVYRKLYGDGSLWLRPKDMFLSLVDRENIRSVSTSTALSCRKSKAWQDSDKR